MAIHSPPASSTKSSTSKVTAMARLLIRSRS
jgi:hypothetical protein